MANRSDTWPDGKTWVFQGTVAEDATAGTHVTSLTVTPGTGNELQFLYGQITVGSTATAQGPAIVITDGSNNLSVIMNPNGATNTVSGEVYIFPQTSNTSALIGTNIDFLAPPFPIPVSGTMTLKLQVTTTAVSVTQIFAVVCRIKGGVPTATLADTVGTPVLTTNTNKVF